jgi:predicted alpha/beta hydrolase family esterase
MRAKTESAKFFLFCRMNAIVLTLPGLYNSGPEHWQTWWEKEYGFTRVNQKDWDTPILEDWIASIDAAVTKHPLDRVVLVGHSAACAAIAAWAAKYRRKIKGALLVAPSDTEAASYPAGPVGFKPMPVTPLGFPSLVIASTDDEYVSLDRAQYFANRWGSEFAFICKAGHINSASNLGKWPVGFELLNKLTR